MKESKLKKAYDINTKFFGKIPLSLNKIKLKICPSRKIFNKFYRKYYKKHPEGNHRVAFVTNYRPKWKTFFSIKVIEIFIVSENVFEKEKEFDRGYYFNVLVHEMAHIFLKYSKDVHNLEEYLCYYVANQKKYHEECYLLGKKHWNFIKNKENQGHRV